MAALFEQIASIKKEHAFSSAELVLVQRAICVFRAFRLLQLLDILLLHERVTSFRL